MSQGELAELLGRSVKTIGRWERGEIDCPPMLGAALRSALDRPSQLQPSAFTFIDLFAGIGGTRLGFERADGRCVFTSEWNAFSRKTYLSNFGNQHEVVGDITKIDADCIPDHDVLLAGFPCQPFSLAGVSKKNSLGRPHGFDCTTQGTLFFDIERIIRNKRPKAFMLENVKNLISHDSRNTFRVIQRVLREELGYHLHFKIIDAKHWVPQHRERIIIVGFKEDVRFDWNDLSTPVKRPLIADILHPEDGSEKPEPPYTNGAAALVDEKYTLSTKLWTYLKTYAEKHRAAGNGFGYGIIEPRSAEPTRTLSARYHKDGSEILVSRGPGRNPRRLTPRECARLMGFPDTFRIPVSDTQAYRQFGNSVVVPVVETVANMIAAAISSTRESLSDPKNYRSRNAA